jgi:hypothetical protein
VTVPHAPRAITAQVLPNSSTPNVTNVARKKVHICNIYVDSFSILLLMHAFFCRRIVKSQPDCDTEDYPATRSASPTFSPTLDGAGIPSGADGIEDDGKMPAMSLTPPRSRKANNGTPKWGRRFANPSVPKATPFASLALDEESDCDMGCDGHESDDELLKKPPMQIVTRRAAQNVRMCASSVDRFPIPLSNIPISSSVAFLYRSRLTT